MRIAVLAAIVFVAAGSAQQAPEAGDLRVDGTVVDADTGQPLANARVQIFLPKTVSGLRGTPDAVASSDKDGSFRIPLTRSSNYSLAVTSNGYLPGRYRNEMQCSPCTVTIGLHAQSKFSGRVVAADSKEPIARVLVEALPLQASGAVASNPADSAMTDRDGEFVLVRLIPGQYFFRFTPSEDPETLIISDAHDAPPQRLLRQWWPGGDAYKNATPFTLAAGTDFRLPDLWLPAEARFQVSGTVRADTCDADAAYTVAIARHRGAGAEPFRSMVVRCGAEFVFADLIPGRYQISLLRKDQINAEMREDLVVTDRNLEKDLTPRRY